MKVTVTCPNGHRIEVDQIRLGTRARCPEEGCGVEFLLEADSEVSATQAPPPPPTVAAPPVGYAVPQGTGERALAPPRKGMAIAALVCGSLGVVGCAPVGIVGLILGIIALLRARRSPQEHGGKGMAIAGICTGAVGSLMIPLLMLSIMMPAFGRAQQLSKRAVCGANVRGIGLAIKIYANDNDEQHPPDLATLIRAGAITTNQLQCPSANATLADVQKDSEFCYIYIKGQNESDDPNNVLLYDRPGNHGKQGASVMFHDGHAEFVTPYSRVDELVAETKKRMAEARKKRQ